MRSGTLALTLLALALIGAAPIARAAPPAGNEPGGDLDLASQDPSWPWRG